MSFLYPPDYQYSLVYLLIILFLSAIILYLGHREEARVQNPSNTVSFMIKFEGFLLKLLLALVILGSLYFFALPSYL